MPKQKDNRVVFRCSAWDYNPTLDKEFLRREKERDELAFRREFGAEAVDLASTYLPADIVRPGISKYGELPRPQGGKAVGAMDEAHRQDWYAVTFCIKDADGNIRQLFAKRWKRAGDSIYDDVSAYCRKYGVTTLWADQFTSVPAIKHYRDRGIHVRIYNLTSSSKMTMYQNLKDLFIEGKIEILNHKQQTNELLGLTVKVTPSTGAPKVEGRVDDMADALALCALKTVGQYNGPAVAKDDENAESPRANYESLRRVTGGDLPRITPDTIF